VTQWPASQPKYLAQIFSTFHSDNDFPMAPATAPVGYSSNNFTSGDPLGTQPGLSASVAVPVMLVLLIFCVGLAYATLMQSLHLLDQMLTEYENRLLGCFLNRGQTVRVNQPDADIEERKRRILSQMVAPTTRQDLELRSPIFTGVAASQNDTGVSKAPETETETGKKLGSQSRVSVHDSVAEGKEECNWYVPLLQRRRTQPLQV
jgi:hypothetical protein